MRRLLSFLTCTAFAMALAPAVCLADEAVQVPDGSQVAHAATADAPVDGALPAEGVDVPAAGEDDGSPATPDGADAAEPEPIPAAPAGDEAASSTDGADAGESAASGLAEDAEGSSSEQPAPTAPAAGETVTDAAQDPASEESPAASVPLADDGSPAQDASDIQNAPAAPDEPAVQTAPVAKTVAVAASLQAAQGAPAKKVAAKAPAKKASASDTAAYLVDKAVYYISSALAKKGKFAVSAADASGKAKVNVALAKGVKQLSQYWRAEYRGNGVYRFVNYSGGYYLAVKGSVKQKANVYVAKSGVLDWKLVKNADGTFSLQPASGKKTYLSVQDGRAKKGANIRLWGSVANKGQKFTFTRNKRLTKAYGLGQVAKPGVVKVSVAGTAVRVGVANDSTKKNAKAATAADSKALGQVFQLRHVGNGLYEFQNANSGMALSVYKSLAKAGTAVVQSKRTQDLGQLWYLQKGDAGYRVLSAKSGLALDVAGGKAQAGQGLVVSKASDASTQRFEFQETQLIQNGTYVIQSAMSLPFVLAVKDNSTDDKANVQINRSRGLSGEKFSIKYLGGGVYRITGSATKKAVDVESASKRNGANIQMAANAGKASQKWVAEVGDAGIMFKSAASGKYLTVKGTQAKSGANVIQKAATGTAAQSWNLQPANWKFYANASSSAMRYISKAETYEGWRYQWGGRSPSTSFDCAGLVMYCANAVLGTHFDLMNTNAEMLYGKLKHISANEARPGDLVFYRGTYGGDVNYISHVVIFAGNGYMYGAGDPIGYAPVNSVRNIKGNAATAVYARIK